MGGESQLIGEAELGDDLAPNIIIVGEDNEPEHTGDALDDPLPQQSHLHSSHGLDVNAIKLDHLEEVEDNGEGNPGEVDGGKHERRAIRLMLVEAINVGEFDPEERIVDHVRDEDDEEVNEETQGLEIFEEQQPAQY